MIPGKRALRERRADRLLEPGDRRWKPPQLAFGRVHL